MKRFYQNSLILEEALLESYEASCLPQYCNYQTGVWNICSLITWYSRRSFGFTFISDKKKLVQDLLEIRFLLEPSIAAMSEPMLIRMTSAKSSDYVMRLRSLWNKKKDHTQKDIEFHTAIAMGSKNLVIPRLIPIINSSIPLFVETTGNILKTETIETHREIADAIAEHNAVRAQDAMYMHLMYNKRCINSSK